MELKNKKFNFLGDSITEGVGVTSPDKKYVEVFAREYGPLITRNYGISGTRFAHQLVATVDNPSYDRDFCSRVALMDSDADFVIVFGGINDFGHGDAPFGKFEDCTPYSFYGASHTLMRSIKERFPTATVVFMTPLHSTPDMRPGKEPILKYRDAICKTAAFYNIPILDLYSDEQLQPTTPSLREKYVPDGVHPNDDGAEIIAKRLGEFLLSL